MSIIVWSGTSYEQCSPSRALSRASFTTTRARVVAFLVQVGGGGSPIDGAGAPVDGGGRHVVSRPAVDGRGAKAAIRPAVHRGGAIVWVFFRAPRGAQSSGQRGRRQERALLLLFHLDTFSSVAEADASWASYVSRLFAFMAMFLTDGVRLFLPMVTKSVGLFAKTSFCVAPQLAHLG